MVLGINKNDSTAGTVLKAGTIGATAGAAAAGVKRFAEPVKDTFTNSLKAQKNFIEGNDAQKCILKAKTVLKENSLPEVYNNAVKILAKNSDPKYSEKLIGTLYEAASETDKGRFNSYSEYFTKLYDTSKGTKEVEFAEKLLENGKPSKTRALKTTAGRALDKIKTTAGEFREGIQKAIKETAPAEGQKRGIKETVSKVSGAVKDFAVKHPSLKKAGKYAAISAGIAAAGALIIKTVSSKKDE